LMAYCTTFNGATPTPHATQEGAMAPAAASATDMKSAPGGAED
jgi:hypothetical protein